MEPQKVTVPVVPVVDTEQVEEAVRQIEAQMRASVAALAPLMQQLGRAFVEFGRAGQVLAQQLQEISRVPEDSQVKPIDQPPGRG